MTIEEIKELYKMIADRDDTVAVLYARIAELEEQVEKMKKAIAIRDRIME